MQTSCQLFILLIFNELIAIHTSENYSNLANHTNKWSISS
ncbi:hypothetical protein HMPREF0880_03283 [Yokenella regensburgei ATCC 43003]|nr:hypothetical protein HMPREF0880_03283 [Yokenella regensburgei ATCC 43003]